MKHDNGLYYNLYTCLLSCEISIYITTSLLKLVKKIHHTELYTACTQSN